MKNEEFIYYIFYIKSKYFNLIPLSSNELSDKIYAYTDDEEVAKLFLSTRNKKIFKLKKEKLSRNEINLLCSRHPNSYILIKDIKTHINTKISHYILALTKTEMIMSQHECDSLLIKLLSHSNFSPNILKKKYKKALCILKYDDSHNYYINGEDGGYNYIGYNTITEIGTPDFLTNFIKLYGNLLVLNEV